MTYLGAIKQLHELRNAEDMPIYYKPVIAEVINTLLMDAEEIRYGHWETEVRKNRDGTRSCFYACSLCGNMALDTFKYCPSCGSRNEVDENEQIDCSR